MPRPPRWREGSVRDGVQIMNLTSWRYFFDYVNQELLDYRTYIYQGQKNAKWPLESSLDRRLRRKGQLSSPRARIGHLENFKQAARGRRGINPPRIENENDWWALGQHHGLATPLLDWTESPFAALYFAFEEEDTDGADHRAVWAVSRSSLTKKSAELLARHRKQGKRGRGPIVEIVQPLTDQNVRLVSQRGLFTRGLDGTSIGAWIRQHYAGDSTEWHLIKFRIPNQERTKCLRTLNRMNINDLSLFPDLYGASKYCNFDLMIKNY